MTSPSRFQLSRHFFLQTALLTIVMPQAWAANPCRGPQQSPDGSLPVGPFGAASTAQEVTEGLDLKGMTALVTACNSGLGFETMRESWRCLNWSSFTGLSVN